MDEIGDIHLRELEGRLGETTYHLTHFVYATFHRTEHWRPSINAYRYADRFVICIDLAGVDQSLIELQIEPRRLLLRGRRPLPEPEGTEGKADPLLQVLTMEIDHGPFERELAFPVEVDSERAERRFSQGLLWLSIPFRAGI